MAIAIDATGTVQTKGTVGTTFTYTGLTIGSSLSNSAAIFIVGLPSSNATSITATWGGTSCTLIRDGHTAGAHAAIFGIINPTSGNQNFIVSWTNSSVVLVGGMSFTGVNQTGGVTSFANATDNGTASGLTQSLTVTTTSADFTFGCAMLGDDTGSPVFTSTPTGTAGPSKDDTATTGWDIQSLTSQSTSTSSSYTGNNGVAAQLQVTGFSLVAAGAGGGPTSFGANATFPNLIRNTRMIAG